MCITFLYFNNYYRIYLQISFLINEFERYVTVTEFTNQESRIRIERHSRIFSMRTRPVAFLEKHEVALRARPSSRLDKSKMEDGDNKLVTELSKDKKSYAGIPEADFVVITH